MCLLEYICRQRDSSLFSSTETWLTQKERRICQPGCLNALIYLHHSYYMQSNLKWFLPTFYRFLESNSLLRTGQRVKFCPISHFSKTIIIRAENYVASWWWGLEVQAAAARSAKHHQRILQIFVCLPAASTEEQCMLNVHETEL